MHQSTPFLALAPVAVAIFISTTATSFGSAFSSVGRQQACRGRAEHCHCTRRRRTRSCDAIIIRASTTTSAEGINNNDVDCSEDIDHETRSTAYDVIEWQSSSESDDAGTNNDDANDIHRFSAEVFASSNCWGRRPFLMRGAFDPTLLLDGGSHRENNNDEADGEEEEEEEDVFAWPSWEEVVDIAADDEAESRYALLTVHRLRHFSYHWLWHSGQWAFV